MVEPNGASITVTYKPAPKVTPTPSSTPIPGGGDGRG
jgi:hypothetical protein